MSDQPTDPTSAIDAGTTDAGVTDAGVTAPGAAEPAAEPASVESPKLAPEHAAEPKADAPDVDAAHGPGRIMVMSPARGDWHDKSWDDAVNDPEPASGASSSGMFGKRRLAALAAVVALAAVTGAIGGAMATAGLGHLFGGDANKTVIAQTRALEESVMRLDADVASLKISAERASRQNTSQFGKTSDRLDRIEKAQADPAAKLAKLSETVDKLRAAPPPAAPVASAPAKETTGSIAPPAAAPAPLPAPVPLPVPKPEIARLPTVEGWTLLDIANGGATIEGRQGLFEVYAGDPIPGLGRVDAIRKQDGRWVVVTTKGLIVAR